MATGIPVKKSTGRPFYISYDGKMDESSVLNLQYPDFRPVYSINGANSTNMLMYGDNRDALLWLLHNGYKEKIGLIYIDPPYATSGIFVNRNQEQAYSDFLGGADFVEFLRQRLIILRELLRSNGSIYVHLDNNMAFVIKTVMDEVFGSENFRAFITRKKCSTKNYTKNTYGNISDYIMFYTKSNNYVWNRPYNPWDFESMVKEYPCVDERTGKRFKKVPIHAPGVRNGDTGKEWKGMLPPKGKHWQFTRDKLDELDAAGEIYWSSTGNPRRKVYCEPDKGIPVQDIWVDYRDSINQSQKTTGYPTEKNLEMLKLIVAASSNEGDIVLDCFAGSGTTLDAAYCGNRRWIGVDNSPESIKAITKRFTKGMESYGDFVSRKAEAIQLEMDMGIKCSFVVMES